MNSFRVLTTDENPQVLGEFECLAYADILAEGVAHQCCQATKIEYYNGRDWVSL